MVDFEYPDLAGQTGPAGEGIQAAPSMTYWPMPRRGGAPRGHYAFRRVSVDAPWLEVNTTDGYRPGFSQILSFVIPSN